MKGLPSPWPQFFLSERGREGVRIGVMQPGRAASACRISRTRPLPGGDRRLRRRLLRGGRARFDRLWFSSMGSGKPPRDSVQGAGCRESTRVWTMASALALASAAAVRVHPAESPSLQAARRLGGSRPWVRRCRASWVPRSQAWSLSVWRPWLLRLGMAEPMWESARREDILRQHDFRVRRELEAERLL